MQHARQEFILLSNISRSFDAGRPVNNRGGTGPIQRCSVRLPAGLQRELERGEYDLLREEDGPRFLSKERSRDQTGHRYPIPLVEV